MKKPSLFRSESWHLLLMLLLSVATQCVALLKSTVTASAFGASLEMDAYNFSNNIILFLFSFLSSGTGSPHFSASPAFLRPLCRNSPRSLKTEIARVHDMIRVK